MEKVQIGINKVKELTNALASSEKKYEAVNKTYEKLRSQTGIIESDLAKKTMEFQALQTELQERKEEYTQTVSRMSSESTLIALMTQQISEKVSCS